MNTNADTIGNDPAAGGNSATRRRVPAGASLFLAQFPAAGRRFRRFPAAGRNSRMGAPCW